MGISPPNTWTCTLSTAMPAKAASTCSTVDTLACPSLNVVARAVALTAEIVMLRARVSYVFGGRCDRCMEEFQDERELDVEHILVTSLENGDEGDFVLIDNYQLPLDELVEADLILSLPFKNLCREDCRGLCPICGKNLNEGLCGCRPQTADPRLEILRQLID